MQSLIGKCAPSRTSNADPSISCYQNMHGGDKENSPYLDELVVHVTQCSQLFQGCTGCDYLGTCRNKHLWHSWHLCQSWKLCLISNALSAAVSGAGINRGQSNQLFSFHLKAVHSPPWNNDVFLIERKVQSNLSQVEIDVVVWVLQSQGANI